MDPYHHKNNRGRQPASSSVPHLRTKSKKSTANLHRIKKQKKATKRGRSVVKWGYVRLKKLLSIFENPFFKIGVFTYKRNISRRRVSYRMLHSKRLCENLYYAHGTSNAKFPDLTRISQKNLPQVKKEFAGPGRRKNTFRVRWRGADPAREAFAATPVKQSKKTGVASEVNISAPLNGKAAFQWKKRLIEMAEKRIVLSGNYCGGEPYNEILELMEKQLTKKPDLKIVILLSPRMVLPSNQENMQRIQEAFPDRFQLVYCGEKWMNTSANLYKKITNHTKGLVVDGKHCVMGGSGIEERWAYSDGVGEKIPKEQQSIRSAMNMIIAKEFRDIDFLFSGEEAGQNMDEELLKLARLWEHYNNASGKQHLDNTVVASMLAEKPEACSTSLPEEHLPEMVTTSNFTLYSQGPEMSRSEFGERLMAEIREAKKHIYIDHQYVHPTPELLDLLAQKINEGIKLTVVTNGVERYSPNGHLMFGSRNRQVRAQLYKKIKPENRHLLNWYEYGHGEKNTPRKATLHSKVVVVDDTVLTGSSNLGFKSLVTCSDHEINLVSKSQDFADKTIAAIEDDAFNLLREVHIDDKGTPLLNDQGEVVKVPLSRKSEHPGKVSLRERFHAKLHAKMGWLIG